MEFIFFMLVIPPGLLVFLSLEQFICVYAAMAVIGLIASVLTYLLTRNNKFKTKKYEVYLRILDDLIGSILSIFIGTVIYALFVGLIYIVSKALFREGFSALESIINSFIRVCPVGKR